MKFLRNIANDMYLPRPPAWMVLTAIVLVIGSWLPLVYIARMRTNPDSAPPIHLFQDMFHQPKYGAQEVNPVFADSRAMRQPVPGTVARGGLIDPHFQLGYRIDDDNQPLTTTDDQGTELPQYYVGMPENVQVTEAFMKRGQQKYNIYCYPCHGTAGYGNGPINNRATELAEQGRAVWTPAANFHTAASDGGLQYGPAHYADGKLYTVISNGIRNMPGYASQIEPMDRWAIVAYVRALQVSQSAPASQVPTDRRDGLRAASWADFAQQQVRAGEATLRQMTQRLNSAERDLQDAPEANRTAAQQRVQLVQGLIDQAQAALEEARTTAAAAQAAAERGELAPARQGGQAAEAAAETIREYQKQLNPQPEGEGEAGAAGNATQTTTPDAGAAGGQAE